MKFRYFLLFVIILLITIYCCIGCGEKKVTDDAQNDTTTITAGFWGSDKEISTYTETAKEIENANPEIKIEMQPFPSSEDFWNNLPTKIAAKTAPDIVKLTNEGSYEYIKEGLIVELNSLIDEAGINMSEYEDTAKEIWSLENKLYGIPVSAAPAMFIINKDMWEEAGLGKYPETWNEVKEAAKSLSNGDRKGLIINIHEFHLTNYILTYGGGWENGKTINSQENVAALEMIEDMFDSGIAMTPSEGGFGWDGEVFANKMGAMSTGGYWYKGYLSESAPDINYDIIPMPKGTVSSCTLHSEGWILLKDSTKKVKALEAIKHLTDDKVLEKVMKVVGARPSKKSLSEKYFVVNPEFRPIEKMLPKSKGYDYPPDTKKFNDSLVKLMQEKILSDSDRSMKDILDELQSSFNK